MKIADIAKIIEAVLFVSGDGVDRDEFKRIYDLSDKELNKCLDILKEKYNEASGINIINYKNKIQLCSNPALADNVAEILNPIRERSLTKAALETVAIVAYKQPITRTEIEQIRGVNCDYAVQLLQSNNLIQVVGRKDAVGKPLLFGTTDEFLKRFELNSLDELPNHKELLDRIRVIHSEGDSLYREFSIPDETDENDENLSGNAENTDENTDMADDVTTSENTAENTESVDVNGSQNIVENSSKDENASQNSEIATENVEQDVEDKLKIEKKKTTKKNKTTDITETEKAVESMAEVENKNDGFSIDNFDMPVKSSGRRKNLIESLQDMPKDNNQEYTTSVKKARKQSDVKNIDDASEEIKSSEVSSEPVKLSWKEKLKLRLAEQAKEEK